jgi:hypothetical protein
VPVSSGGWLGVMVFDCSRIDDQTVQGAGL